MLPTSVVLQILSDSLHQHDCQLQHAIRELEARSSIILAHFFSDIEAAKDMMARYNILYSGYAALQFLLWPNLCFFWEYTLELYLPYYAHDAVVDHMRNAEAFTCNDIELTEEYIHHMYTRVETIAKVTICYTESTAIQLVSSIDENPLLPITTLWSTHIMNAVGSEFAFSAYPDLTFRGIAVINQHDEHDHPSRSFPPVHWLYYKRARFCIGPHSCTAVKLPDCALHNSATVRTTDDQHCLVASLQHPAVPKHFPHLTQWNLGGWTNLKSSKHFASAAACTVDTPPNSRSQRHAT
ncbi:hypothetical protein NM688_g554 [Phlebia brevispora]|uniref:Uncharacterized protein n=1 Tax=Phlebia brevispora TaxID=194682 RepID=A0ACC1TEB6_9APHY|nr:hypothetical protein NM688_g554 [Phlebia brevispora]